MHNSPCASLHFRDLRGWRGDGPGLEARPNLISLPQARMVAAATNNLCEAANAAVQGHASQEKLISSAKQVAASTAQLLVACKVKADQDSEAMKRLQVRPPGPSLVP